MPPFLLGSPLLMAWGSELELKQLNLANRGNCCLTREKRSGSMPRAQDLRLSPPRVQPGGLRCLNPGEGSWRWGAPGWRAGGAGAGMAGSPKNIESLFPAGRRRPRRAGGHRVRVRRSQNQQRQCPSPGRARILPQCPACLLCPGLHHVGVALCLFHPDSVLTFS